MLAFATCVAVILSIAELSTFGPAQFVLLEGAVALLAAPAAAYWIDRHSPRRVLIGVEFVTIASLSVLAGELIRGLPVLVALVAACATVHQVARDACVLDTLPVSLVTQASGLDQAAASAGLIVGPALGALLASRFELGTIAAAFAAAHVPLAFLAWTLPRRQAADPEPMSFARAFYPCQSLKDLEPLAAAAFVCGVVLGGTWIAAAPRIVVQSFHVALGWVGLQMMLAAFAGVCGGLLAPLLIARRGHRNVMIATAAGEAASFYAYAFSASLWTSCLAVACIGISSTVFLVAFYAHLQQISKPGERGRLFGLICQIDLMAVAAGGAVAWLWISFCPTWPALALLASAYGLTAAAMALRPQRVATGEARRDD